MKIKCSLQKKDMIEGGLSLTYGNDFSIFDKKKLSEIFSFKIDNNLRLRENKDLPGNSKIRKKTSSILNNKPLYKNLGDSYNLPLPLMNIINGGAHADNDLKIQEFMIRPDSAKNFMDALEKCFLVIQNLKRLLLF